MDQHAVPALIEGLSRALLARRVTPEQFAERLITLHEIQQSEADPDHARVQRHAIAEFIATLEHAAVPPRSLRVAQPHELVQRAARLNETTVIAVVQAGLQSIAALHNGQRLLLLAALDRLVVIHERRAALSRPRGEGIQV